MPESALPTPEVRRGVRLSVVLPLVIFLGLVVFLAVGLSRDPTLVPSPLIGKPAPAFDLPPLQGRTLGLTTEDLRGEVSLVNVFASWCVACRVEHPLFMELQRRGVVAIHGINHKDRPEDARAWLAELGDPYIRIGADLDGRVSIDWGVYGVPETFVVDKEGVIRFKHIGPITPEAWEETIRPLIEELER